MLYILYNNSMELEEENLEEENFEEELSSPPVQDPNCIFCKIIAGQINAKIVYQDEDLVAFKDLNPQAPIHILLVPTRHIPSLSEADDGDVFLIGKIQLAAAKIAQLYKVSDYRLVLNTGKGAGQTVGHMHYHFLAGRRLMWPPG